LNKLIELDRQLFLFLNSLHGTWADQPMYYISSEWLWIPLYGFFIYLIIKKLKSKAWLSIISIIIAVVISDQVSTQIKKGVQRFRPTHDLVLSEKVHTVNNYLGGNYGFVSSHASNTFCVALLVTLVLETSVFSTFLIFIWAFLVSYSRIYLGVHFPLDIIFGAILGMFIAFLLFLLIKRYKNNFFSERTLPKF
jgi:undecaprenyl-diphosphatase